MSRNGFQSKISETLTFSIWHQNTMEVFYSMKAEQKWSLANISDLDRWPKNHL